MQRRKTNGLRCSTDLPKGRYKIVFRLQDLNVTDDISVIVTGSVSGELINETFTTVTRIGLRLKHQSLNNYA